MSFNNFGRELTELENEIRMWGMEADDPAEYQHRIPRIKQQYIKFTRNRFYLVQFPECVYIVNSFLATDLKRHCQG